MSFDGAQLIYRDGGEAASEPAFLSLPDTSFSFAIGEGFDGVLDEVAIYPHALSALRVKEHHRIGAGL